MLPAALLLLALLLLLWAKMSNSRCEQKEPEDSPAGPSLPGRQSPPGRQQPPPRAGRAGSEQEQLAVYNPAALRRPALAKFVLGSFDDNSSDDELMATAFRVGRRRSSLAGVAGTVPEPPTVSDILEPNAGIRYGWQPPMAGAWSGKDVRLGRAGACGRCIAGKIGVHMCWFSSEPRGDAPNPAPFEEGDPVSLAVCQQCHLQEAGQGVPSKISSFDVRQLTPCWLHREAPMGAQLIYPEETTWKPNAAACLLQLLCSG